MMTYYTYLNGLYCEHMSTTEVRNKHFGGTVPIIRHRPAPSVTDAERAARPTFSEEISVRVVSYRAMPLPAGQCMLENIEKRMCAMQEMDQEKLIENVRPYEALYVMTHAKYSDIRFKENAWKEIGKKVKQPAIICKKTWTNLRDSFRRALKKKRELKIGQAAFKIKKWKFEDEMSFLTPHLQERETGTNLARDTDDNDDEDNEVDDVNEDADNENYRDNDRDDNRGDDNDDETDDNIADGNDYNNCHVEDEKMTRKKAVKRKIVNQVTAKRKYKLESKPVVIEYLLGNKQIANAQTRQQPNQEPSAIDTFFSSIALTVKNFSPYYQNIAKSQIFNIITDLEMKQIMQCQQEQLELPNTSMLQRCYAPILESHHTHNQPYDVPRPSPSASPSTTATPSPSPSQKYFPCSVPTIHHGENLVNKK